MLRRLSVLAVSAAAVAGLALAPALSASAAPAARHGVVNFTVPSVSRAVVAYGSYQLVNPHRLVVRICAKQTGAAFAVGAQAWSYNANYTVKHDIAAVVLRGKGVTECGYLAFAFTTAHLQVHTFIGGNNGRIIKVGKVKKLF
jgi:hypothetical protein